ADRCLHVLLPDATRARADDPAPQRRLRRVGRDGRSVALAHHPQPPAAAPRPHADRLGGDRRRDEHPDRGRLELHRCRRADLDVDVGLAALDGLGDDPQPDLPADHAERPVHAVADDLPDARDPGHGRVAEPAGRRPAPCARPAGARMTRLPLILVRRFVGGVLTVVGVTTLAFGLFWATHTEPAQFVYPNAFVLTPYQVAHGNHVLGTDRSKVTQWLDYESHLLRFDLGSQWGGLQLVNNQRATGRAAIAPQLYPSLRVTLSLLLGGAAVVLLLALPLGTFAGSRIGSFGDRTLSIVALLAICTHPMVIGLLVRLLFADRLNWAPPGGYCTFIKHG